MVVRCKQHDTLEIDEAVVDGSDGLEVEVVGGLVEQEYIAAEHHHAREHAAHLFAAGKHLHGLIDVFAGEQHFAEETAQIRFGGVFGILLEPANDGIFRIGEIGGIILREIGLTR